MSRRTSFALVVLAFLGSCSFLVSFDPRGQACDAARNCLQGYQCVNSNGLFVCLDAGVGGGSAGGLDGGSSGGAGGAGGAGGGAADGGGDSGVADSGVPDAGRPTLKPNIMLLLDRSGSMATVMAAPDTRLTVMNRSVTEFVQSNPTIGRYGVTFFPGTTGTCGSIDAIDLPFPDAGEQDTDLNLRTQAGRVKEVLVPPMTPVGGSAITQALAFVRMQGGLMEADRDNVLLVITDGTPNCNTNNPNNVCTAPNPACRCTLAGGVCTNQTVCSTGCADISDATRTVQVARAFGIRVVIIGIGAETAVGDARLALNEMATVGGAPRTCTAADGCGIGDSCDLDAGLCATRYYQSTTEADLTQALNTIARTIQSF